ncbi:MAG: alpha/beta fold hydrolase [Myxococcaceae bacterium]|nr:alpha/beta fold hydrolase [Myxococcaceae bacterium]
MISEHDVTVDGVRLHYAVAGDGPPIVLVPGQSFPWMSYQKVMPALAVKHRVYAMDVRGHGKSEHTPGQYTFSRCGKDLVAFLREVVRAPALLSGNSSGGLICLWAAANAPALVRGVLLEDPPLFSTEWPRMRDDTWVHDFFTHVVATLPDLAGFFSTLKLPTRPGKALMNFPRPLAWVLGGAIRRHQRARPGQPVDLWWLPMHVRLFVRGLSEYDIGFTQACVDGSISDMDQGDALARARCPMVLLQASSFRDPELGLVGAMDDDDLARAKALKPDLVVESWPKPHVVHLAAPKQWLALIARVEQLAGPPPRLEGDGSHVVVG